MEATRWSHRPSLSPGIVIKKSTTMVRSTTHMEWVLARTPLVQCSSWNFAFVEQLRLRRWADVAQCWPGTKSSGFRGAVLNEVNYTVSKKRGFQTQTNYYCNLCVQHVTFLAAWEICGPPTSSHKIPNSRPYLGSLESMWVSSTEFGPGAAPPDLFWKQLEFMAC